VEDRGRHQERWILAADGKALSYVAADRSVTVAEVSTSPGFTFAKPEVLFHPQGTIPDTITDIGTDGEHFLALPAPKGQQLKQLTIFDRDGKVLRKIGEPGFYLHPTFSPDATRLAVRKTDPATGQQNLWVFEIANGKATQLTNDNVTRHTPLLWSPDGRYLLYVTLRSHDYSVERKATDGTGGEEVLFRYTHGATIMLNDISADGKKLILESGRVILEVPLSGSDPLARTAIESLREEFDDAFGRLSPDGRYLALCSDEAQAERSEVYVRPFDTATGMAGDAKWQVSRDGAVGMLAWRGDGKEIFYRGLNLDSNDLRVMAAEVTTTPAFHADTPKLLFKLPGPIALPGLIDGDVGNISRYGRQFVFAVNLPAGGGER
jgi:dipeptidyl aminopeptidase/acylaminoacyl peptidase